MVPEAPLRVRRVGERLPAASSAFLVMLSLGVALEMTMLLGALRIWSRS